MTYEWETREATEKHQQRVAGRPSFEAINLLYATSLALRSTCRRLAVGCVIVSPDFQSVYSAGYNGNARGLPNDCDVVGDAAVGGCGCIHAEANAITKCGVPHTTPKTVITTHSPCMACAKLLIQLEGVQRVVYAEEYRLTASLDMLRQEHIVVERWPRDALALVDGRALSLIDDARRQLVEDWRRMGPGVTRP